MSNGRQRAIPRHLQELIFFSLHNYGEFMSDTQIRARINQMLPDDQQISEGSFSSLKHRHYKKCLEHPEHDRLKAFDSERGKHGPSKYPEEFRKWYIDILIDFLSSVNISIIEAADAVSEDAWTQQGHADATLEEMRGYMESLHVNRDCSDVKPLSYLNKHLLLTPNLGGWMPYFQSWELMELEEGPSTT